ncbi:MAG: NAD(P)/FAD-dependent oxidoreductase [Bacteroidota bacterium]
MKKSVAIIGGGPAGLILAAKLDPVLFDVCIYEKNKSLGRKFLVAGKGGFNLTHSEEIKDFIERYTPSDFLKQSLLDFTNNDLRAWLENIGIPTFVGSSKRVYPEKGIKPIEVLNKIVAVLEEKNVTFAFEKEFIGWGENDEIVFRSGERIKSDIIVFSLGGGSWKVTGSDGSWLNAFQNKGIQTSPFKPANCAYQIDWKPDFIVKHGGSPLKNIVLSCTENSQKGELVVTDFGLEGNAIYALSPQIQNQLDENGEAQIHLDLKPHLTSEQIQKKLLNSSKKLTQSLTEDIKLSRTQVDLLKNELSKDEFLDYAILVSKIKALPLRVISAAKLDEAISTTGGVLLSSVDEKFMLKQIPNQYCIGEMLDWNAPTGGYLLQACFSFGVSLSSTLNSK